MRVVIGAALAVLLTLPAWAQRPAVPSAAAPAAPPHSAPAPTAASRAAPAAAPAPAAAMKVDVNSATESQLEALPGVGPVRAKAIIAGRPYSELQDMVKKKALPQSVLDGSKHRMALANINTSSATELAKTLPGIGLVRANAIVGGRPYGKPDELVLRNILSQGVYDKMKDVVAY